MTRARPLALALVLLAASALVPAPAHAAAPVTLRSEKGLEYSIRIPDGYDRSKGAVLVLALHGVNEKQANFMRTMDSMPFLKSAIVVVPQAPGEGARWEEKDVATVADLVREIQEEHRPPRTVVYGFSAGAYFTFRMALGHPELFAAAIPHSGGLGGRGVDAAAAKEKGVAFYVIHGDADGVVPTQGSRDAVAKLKEAGLTVEYEELKGVAHTLDHPATGRAFAWVEKTLGPACPELTEAETNERLAAVQKAVKAKDWTAAAAGFPRLRGAPRSLHGKVLALAKAQLACPEEAVALAALECCGRCGEDGVAVLRTVSPDKEALAKAAAAGLSLTGAAAAAEVLLGFAKAKSEAVAVAAARELGRLGGEASELALIQALAAAEGAKTQDSRGEAIQGALRKLTKQSLGSAKEWKKWWNERGGH